MACINMPVRAVNWEIAVVKEVERSDNLSRLQPVEKQKTGRSKN